MECRYTSGTQYILESKYHIPTFSSTNPIFMWMCLDLRRASAYSYYYYLNSPVEFGFDGYRLVGLPDATTSVSDVCTETPDTAEFYTMIKDGFETDAVNAVQCADPVLGSFSYTYTDDSGVTSCENAISSFINACDNSNRTHILVNNSDCMSINPFYSSSGQLGCIANVQDSNSDVYYISLYNLDTSPTTQFICIAVTKDSNGTVYLSMKQTDCVSNQSPTTAPTGGATMVLSAYCLIDDSDSKKRNWTWLFIFLPCLALLIIFIVVCLCLYYWLKKRETQRARRKTALVNADHPLGEVSMKLDAPASLGLQHGYIDRKRDLFHKHAQSRKSEDEEDLFCEQSLDLNLETKTWTQLERGKRPPVINKAFSGAVTTSSNGSIPNGYDRKSKQSKSIAGRWKSKTKNFLTTRMAANSFRGGIKSNHSKSYERSTRASSGRGPNLKISNGIHPEPIKKTKSVAGSRPGSRAESRAVSRTGSRRGSIDNLVISRNNRMPRSKTMVLARQKEEKKPDIFTMPEEYVIEGGPNEVMPTRPIPVTSNILRDTYQSLNRRSLSKLTLKKPGASKKPWH